MTIAPASVAPGALPGCARGHQDPGLGGHDADRGAEAVTCHDPGGGGIEHDGTIEGQSVGGSGDQHHAAGSAVGIGRADDDVGAAVGAVQAARRGGVAEPVTGRRQADAGRVDGLRAGDAELPHAHGAGIRDPGNGLQRAAERGQAVILGARHELAAGDVAGSRRWPRRGRWSGRGQSWRGRMSPTPRELQHRDSLDGGHPLRAQCAYRTPPFSLSTVVARR